MAINNKIINFVKEFGEFLFYYCQKKKKQKRSKVEVRVIFLIFKIKVYFDMVNMNEINNVALCRC